MLPLQLPELPHEAVVLRVGQGRAVEDVVLVVGTFQGRTELGGPLDPACIRGRGHVVESGSDAQMIRFRPPCLAE